MLADHLPVLAADGRSVAVGGFADHRVEVYAVADLLAGKTAPRVIPGAAGGFTGGSAPQSRLDPPYGAPAHNDGAVSFLRPPGRGVVVVGQHAGLAKVLNHPPVPTDQGGPRPHLGVRQ